MSKRSNRERKRVRDESNVQDRLWPSPLIFAEKVNRATWLDPAWNSVAHFKRLSIDDGEALVRAVARTKELLSLIRQLAYGQDPLLVMKALQIQVALVSNKKTSHLSALIAETAAFALLIEGPHNHSRATSSAPNMFSSSAIFDKALKAWHTGSAIPYFSSVQESMARKKELIQTVYCLATGEVPIADQRRPVLSLCSHRAPSASEGESPAFTALDAVRVLACIRLEHHRFVRSAVSALHMTPHRLRPALDKKLQGAGTNPEPHRFALDDEFQEPMEVFDSILGDLDELIYALSVSEPFSIEKVAHQSGYSVDLVSSVIDRFPFTDSQHPYDVDQFFARGGPFRLQPIIRNVAGQYCLIHESLALPAVHRMALTGFWL